MTPSPSTNSVQLFFPGRALLYVDSTCLQNIVGSTISEFTANPVRPTDMDVSGFSVFQDMETIPSRRNWSLQ